MCYRDWDKMKSEMFANEYHKAKADGSNPELVKAVEELLIQDCYHLLWQS